MVVVVHTGSRSFIQEGLSVGRPRRRSQILSLVVAVVSPIILTVVVWLIGCYADRGVPLCIALFHF